MNAYKARLNANPLTLDYWRTIRANSPREAGAKFAADLGQGTHEVAVMHPRGPKHPNGMPMAVHVFTCEVGPCSSSS